MAQCQILSLAGIYFAVDNVIKRGLPKTLLN